MPYLESPERTDDQIYQEAEACETAQDPRWRLRCLASIDDDTLDELTDAQVADLLHEWEENQMATYWHHHDRGFANLCVIVRATNPDQERILTRAGFERLTIAQLRPHVRWVNGETESANYGIRHGITEILNGAPAYDFHARDWSEWTD